MIYLLSYAVFCIFLAHNNSERIKDGKRIYHGINGAIHVIAACVSWFIYRDLKIPICVLLTARLVFDTALSLFRGLPFDYVSVKPKSIIDRLEKAVFGMNGWLPKLIYLIITIILLIWHGKAS